MKEKKLEDLTKEEIGHLFPIEISAYDKEWPELFEREKCLIIETLPEVLFSASSISEVPPFLDYRLKIPLIYYWKWSSKKQKTSN